MERHRLKATDLLALHDKDLHIVSMDRDNKSLQLGSRGGDRTTYTFSFENVLTYRINNIQYQNVVSRILASSVASDFGGDLEKIVRWTSSVPPGRLLISEENLQIHIGRIRSG